MFGMLSVLAEFQRELIVANTRDGLAGARARGRKGGRRPKLTPDQTRQAQRLYDEGDHTVQQIADMFGVKRGSLYGYLDRATVELAPDPELMKVAIRLARPEDHDWIITVVDGWWDRQVSASVPGCSWITSIRQVWWQSGVDPAQRSLSIGRQLYERFFELAIEHGATEVQAITSASNENSIAFHRQLGFTVSDPIDGYDRPGVAHVRFTKPL